MVTDIFFSDPPVRFNSYTATRCFLAACSLPSLGLHFPSTRDLNIRNLDWRSSSAAASATAPGENNAGRYQCGDLGGGQALSPVVDGRRGRQASGWAQTWRSLSCSCSTRRPCSTTPGARRSKTRPSTSNELLHKLRDTAYNADDVLDELEYFRIPGTRFLASRTRSSAPTTPPPRRRCGRRWVRLWQPSEMLGRLAELFLLKMDHDFTVVHGNPRHNRVNVMSWKHHD
ncbi:hypothetical protein PR202_ga27558 [Eleusine coracana subsp. coracana]|uniref:Rx N-terminal domain-containing protein n=1 Tax=Eleusine coracana subsp. coracana TaxID=191504 RepID=A0AAV5DG95_ELECO|nr:hypothetical protein PR202_ga27558 [Eleusine coracana subsp. coracana]